MARLQPINHQPNRTVKRSEKLTPIAARKLGYRPLTNPYKTDEEPMLDNALRSLRGCNIVLVDAIGGVEIWRAAVELKNHQCHDQ